MLHNITTHTSTSNKGKSTSHAFGWPVLSLNSILATKHNSNLMFGLVAQHQYLGETDREAQTTDDVVLSPHHYTEATQHDSMAYTAASTVTLAADCNTAKIAALQSSLDKG